MQRLYSSLFLFVSLLLFSFAGIAQNGNPQSLKVEDSTTLFRGLNTTLTRGSIIKTKNNHYYEINDKINQKVQMSDAIIVVYKDGKKWKMSIQGIDQLLICNKIDDIIESNIDGAFTGYDGNTSFKLENREEWKQDAPTSTVYANLYRPAVMIYRTPEGYKMKIDGLNEAPIIVRKL